HTRSTRDWSSDVCSSDLTGGSQTHTATINLSVTSAAPATQQLLGNTGFENGSANPSPWIVSSGVIDNSTFQAAHTGSWKAWLNRSEERRVGKEGSSRCSA